MPPEFIRGLQLSPGNFAPMFKVFCVWGTLRTRDLTALIDSGADRTIVPFLIPEALGIRWETLADAPDVAGFGGSDAEKFWDVDLRATLWPAFSISDRVAVVRRAVPLVLGRDDFLSRVRVEFHWYRDPPFYGVEQV